MRLNQYEYHRTVLGTYPLFSSLNPTQLRALTLRMSLFNMDKGSLLFSSDMPVSKFYILLRGRVKIYTYDEEKDRELTLFILREGDCFDIFSLYGQSCYPLYYKTLDGCELLSCPIKHFREWLHMAPEFNSHLTTYIIEKMASLQESFINMVLDDTATRVLKLLWRNANAKKREIELINDLSDKELAALIGTTRAVMNRHLQKFKEEGILRIGRKRIEVMNWELLEAKVAQNLNHR